MRWFESIRPSHVRAKTAARARAPPSRLDRSRRRVGAVTAREVLDGVFDAWRIGDALRAVAHFAPDARYREARREAIVGRDAILEHFTLFFRDGPRWRFEVDRIAIDGDSAAVRYRFAIETEPDRWTDREGCAFVTFADSTIAEWREYEG